MKRKLLLLFFFVFLACGCTSLQKDSYQTILADAMNSRISLQNIFRAGYKYYLPKGMRIFHHEGSNEIFGYQDTRYYMYVDRVSYYHRIHEDYMKKVLMLEPLISILFYLIRTRTTACSTRP